MKIVILGGSGFLGSHLADYLILKNHKVIIFDRKKSNYFNKKCKMVIGNLHNTKLLEKSLKGADAVYHYAGISDIGYSIKEPFETMNSNILGTYKVLEACKKLKIKRLIFASTIYVQSSQGSFYRVSKHSSELLIREFNKKFGLNYTILRFGSVYGARASINNGLTKIIYKYLKNKKYLQYDGSSKAQRKFINVKDVSKTSLEILKKKYINKTVLITGRTTMKIKNVMSIIAKVLNTKAKFKFKNKQQLGHYVFSPNVKEKIRIFKLNIKNTKSFSDGIYEIINDIMLN